MNPASLLSRNNAWIFTCELWAKSNLYIILPVNPGTLDITLPIHKTNEVYRSTRITYVWREPTFKSVFDSPVLEFTISSGNALPMFNDEYIEGCSFMSKLITASDNPQQLKKATDYVSSTYAAKFPGSANHEDVRTGLYAEVGTDNVDNGVMSTAVRNAPNLYFSDLPIGIQNLYAFHALVDERRLFKDTDKTYSQDNRVVVSVNTPAFPRLMVYGWFSESGLTVSEGVDQFGEVTCSFSLVVTDTYPRLSFNHWERLMSNYRENNGASEPTLDWTRIQLGLQAQQKQAAQARSTPPSAAATVQNDDMGMA